MAPKVVADATRETRRATGIWISNENGGRCAHAATIGIGTGTTRPRTREARDDRREQTLVDLRLSVFPVKPLSIDVVRCGRKCCGLLCLVLAGPHGAGDDAG